MCSTLVNNWRCLQDRVVQPHGVPALMVGRDKEESGRLEIHGKYTPGRGLMDHWRRPKNFYTYICAYKRQVKSAPLCYKSPGVITFQLISGTPSDRRRWGVR